MKNDRQIMGIEVFKEIINKILNYSKFNPEIHLYNWTEPFLCQDIYNYIAYVKEKKLNLTISTNLSLPDIPALIPSLGYIDNLLISVSGFTQKTYQINHKNGNINFVKHNLKLLSAALKKYEFSTKVIIRYILFDYNKQEFQLFERFAHNLSLNFTKLKGSGNPLKENKKCIINDIFYDELYKDKPMSPIVKFKQSSQCNFLCSKIFNQFPIDHKGDVYLCCLHPNIENTKIGNFLYDDFNLLQYLRYIHPICNSCRSYKPVFPTNDINQALINGAENYLKIDIPST